MQNANRVYFGRFEDGPLDNPFAGNLADLCPTGTLTDKPGRFVARRWDCQRAPSVCLHCSLGCNVTALSRYRRVARIEARDNAEVNGAFICDRGRYGFGYQSAPERPRLPQAAGRPVSTEEALRAAAGLLASAAKRHGPDAVAVVGGQRSTMETQAALTALARAAGWRAPAFFSAAKEQKQARQALYALTPPRARSLADLAKADAVLVVGVSPLPDAPMLTLALRQAARAGAKVFLADPRPLALPLDHDPLPLAPGQLPVVLAVAGAGEDASGLVQQHFPLAPELWPRLETLAQTMAKAKRPAIVYAPALAGSLPDDDRFGLLPVLPAAGTAGAALLAPTEAPGLDDLAEDVAAGRIKAVFAVETDLFAAAPALAARLTALEALVVLDHLPTPTVAAAQVFLPTATLFETGGTLAASDGRLQRAEPVQAPGLSVLADGAGDHPPRDYARPLPGTDPAPAAFWCDRLGRALGVEMPRHPLAEALAAHPVLAGLDPAALPDAGQRPAYPGREPAAPESTPAQPAQGLAVVLETPFFGGDELSRYTPLLADKTGPAVALLHPADAAGLGLTDGATVALDCGDASATAVVRLHPGLARGVVVVPRLPQFDALPPNLGPGGLRRRETP